MRSNRLILANSATAKNPCRTALTKGRQTRRFVVVFEVKRDFGSPDGDIVRRRNPDSNPVPLDAENGDLDIVADDDFLIYFARQNEHERDSFLYCDQQRETLILQVIRRSATI